MKRRHFTPERDFSFAADTFALVGELVKQVAPAPAPRQDGTLEMFTAELTREIDGAEN